MKKFSFVLSAILVLVFFTSQSVNAAQIRVGVADFIDRSNGIYSNPIILAAITESFTKILASSSNNIEVTNSKSFQALNGLESFANAGKSAECQYVILGALIEKNIDSSQSYKKNGFLSVPTINAITYTYTTTLDLRVIDVETGKIVFSTSGTGKASYSQNMKEAATVDSSAQKYEKASKMSLESAASMAAEKICAFLTGEYPEVSSKTNVPAAKKSKSKKKSKKAEQSASLGTVTINRGSLSGVNEKTFYKIFFEGEEVVDFNGNSLGREKFNIAVAEVTTSKSDFCTASVRGGIFENVREGDKAEQITPEEAQSIIAGNDFAKTRISEFLK